jgi:signal transduction histidine kinase
MKHVTKVIGMFLSVFAFNACAADASTEAIAMVKKAVALVKESGRDKAIATFNDPNGEFKKGDLYVFVSGMDGKMLANGANARLIGKDLINLKDSDGKFFVQSYIALAKTKGQGWVDYKWVNPQTKAIDQKSSYIEKVDDLIVGCGIYKE